MLNPLKGMVCAAALSASLSAEPLRIALVFDDGPHPEMAERLLEILDEAEVKVSFAQVGRTVQQYPKSTLALRDAGHEIVNHSLSHRDIDQLSQAEVQEEVAEAQDIMTELLGSDPRWYWPPFLKVDDRLRSEVADAGLELFEAKAVVVSMDYDRSVSADEIERLATTGVTDGAVVLFHEWREETVERLPSILATLKDQGCSFFTFSGLAEQLAE